MADESRVDAELQRTRERLHKLESTALAVNMKIDQIIRGQNKMASQVERLARANEIAEAVAEKMREQGGVIKISWFTKLAGFLIAASAVAGVILQAVNG